MSEEGTDCKRRSGSEGTIAAVQMMLVVAQIGVAVVEMGRNGGIQELFGEVRVTRACDVLAGEMLRTLRGAGSGGRGLPC